MYRKPSSSSAPSQTVLFSPAIMRWLAIAIRTAHIATTGVLFGGLLLAVDFIRLGSWHWWAVATGVLLLILEWTHDRRWPHRGKGLLVHVHVLCCLLIHVLPDLRVPLLWMILISGCMGSHMQRRYRHWSVLEGWEQGEQKKMTV